MNDQANREVRQMSEQASVSHPCWLALSQRVRSPQLAAPVQPAEEPLDLPPELPRPAAVPARPRARLTNASGPGRPKAGLSAARRARYALARKGDLPMPRAPLALA